MTKAFVMLDETGVYVAGAGYSNAPPENAIVLPEGFNPYFFGRHYIFEGEMMPRPVAPVPQLTNGVWSVSGAPVGTLINVRDLISGEDMAEVVTTDVGEVFEFSLLDDGTYEVEVDAPLPYVDTKTKIEVT